MYALVNKMYVLAIVVVFNPINFITNDYDIDVYFIKKYMII